MKTKKRKTSSTDQGCDRFWFDEEEARRAVRFFEERLVHVEAEWADKPLLLEDWQKDQIIRPLFGWKRRSDGTRKYRTAFIALPRKNGKSILSSGIALKLLAADREPGAQVYSAAADREQAAIVFEAAKGMVEASPRLSERISVFKRSLVVRSTRSSYKVLSREARTKHGQNAHGIIFDELHTQTSRELWDTLRTGTVARRQPLLVAITTAGYDRHSLCYQEWEYARKVRDGIIDDPFYLPVIYEAPEDADWTSPEVWKATNPNYGISVKVDYLEAECAKAKEQPAEENTFRQLHLNQWTEQAVRWMPMERWDACGKEPIDEAALAGRPCYTAIDLSSTLDVTAMVHVFPDGEGDDRSYIIVPRFFIPKEAMRQRVKRDRVPYDVWVREGLITATEGDVIDYRALRQAFDADAQKFAIAEVGYDRWGATQFTQEIEEAGKTIVPIGQGFVSMSPPTKALMTLILQKRIKHGGNPVLRWMASNIAVAKDAAGNLKPAKDKSTEKIDGIVAAIMGLDRAMRNEGPKESVYKTRGIRTLG
ncbi:MAG TPA: terminase TerL endonuclease subunit [Vulgatibacter sp.]